jgi:hypothetical protein
MIGDGSRAAFHARHPAAGGASLALRVLIHICCAPCALVPTEELAAEGMEMMGLYYNPNIQPYAENRRRRETVEGWARGQGLRLIVQDEYDPESWMRAVCFREGQRCRLCLHQRLDRAAAVAKKGGFDAFTTTLLYSVRQQHELAAETAGEAARARGVEFLYRDWRPGWRRGVERSRALGLYRQQYCGCLFSERDRYLGRPRAAANHNGGR